MLEMLCKETVRKFELKNDMFQLKSDGIKKYGSNFIIQYTAISKAVVKANVNLFLHIYIFNAIRYLICYS